MIKTRNIVLKIYAISSRIYKIAVLFALICSHLLHHCLLFTVTHCHLLSLVAIRRHTSCFVVICCHSIYHSLSFVVTRCNTRCHSLCHSLSFVVTHSHSLHHSLSFVVTRCQSMYHSSAFL